MVNRAADARRTNPAKGSKKVLNWAEEPSPTRRRPVSSVLFEQRDESSVDDVVGADARDAVQVSDSA